MRTGVEVFLKDGLPEVNGKRVGLITNHTGVDSKLRSTADLLHDSDRVRLVALFGPEHGVRGEAQAGVRVSSSVDAFTGLPVHSLYGEMHAPTSEMLEDIDALIYDVQEVGSRYATYAATMAACQESAAAHGLPFVVLDRPNPITGQHLEGNVLNPAYKSNVGIHPITIRPGMTAGELARLFAADEGWPEPLVVPVEGWRREQWFDQTGLPWVQPSPNLPTLDSTTLYPGTCMIEGTNISEGRGTTRPFELVGAPWLNPFDLTRDLNSRNLPGVAFRPAYFTPVFSKHANESCGGVQVHITDRERLRPAELGIHLLHAVRAQNPERFRWLWSGGERYFIDLLLGDNAPREVMSEGGEPGDVTSGWERASAQFDERRQPYLLY